MDASGESEEKVLFPSQETQQRNSRETAPQGLSARARSLPVEVLDEGAASAPPSRQQRRQSWTRRGLPPVLSSCTKPFSKSRSPKRCFV